MMKSENYTVVTVAASACPCMTNDTKKGETMDNILQFRPSEDQQQLQSLTEIDVDPDLPWDHMTLVRYLFKEQASWESFRDELHRFELYAPCTFRAVRAAVGRVLWPSLSAEERCKETFYFYEKWMGVSHAILYGVEYLKHLERAQREVWQLPERQHYASFVCDAMSLGWRMPAIDDALWQNTRQWRYQSSCNAAQRWRRSTSKRIKANMRCTGDPMDVEGVHLELLRHALGMNRTEDSYRNLIVVPSIDPVWTHTQQMAMAGLLVGLNYDASCARSSRTAPRYYAVTSTGKELVGYEQQELDLRAWEA
jgi:hypothetical protein